MKFKTRMISTAVVAALGTLAGTAQAVNLGADGQGQVLIYPYYTVQSKGSNPFDTYITLVNSDSVRGKAVKVRVIEGKASREVLDFNLYLSPNDMWTAALTRDGSGNPILRTTDTSCTAPEIPVVSGTTREVGFVNFAYAGDVVADDSLARAKEGYVEIIQMADLVDNLLNANGKDTFDNAKHASGVPANCAQIRSDWLTGGFSTATNGVSTPTGGLSGSGTLINVGEGTDVTYDAVPLDAFSDVANHQTPGSIAPDLGAVSPALSIVFRSQNDVTRTDWTGSALAAVVPVSAVLDRNEIINEYAVAAQPVGLSTDWVVTFPTKRLHLANSPGSIAPFTKLLTKTGACEPVSLTTFNREEGVQTSGLVFSPPPPTGVNTLCWEANVVSMANGGTTSNALGSANVRQTLALPFAEGWLRMGFTQTMVTPAASTTDVDMVSVTQTGLTTATYTGLPVVGFAAETFVNNSTLANFGSSTTHRYNRSISLQ